MSDQEQWVLTLDLPPAKVEALEEALAALQDPETPPTFSHFEADDAGAIWRFSAYFLPAPDADAVRRAVEKVAGADVVVEYGPVPDKDWVLESLQALKPVTAGRFFVHGRHDADKVPNDVIAIEIEAAQAFGSGNHATTQGCLIAIDELATRGLRPKRILDLGCGTGILAIAAARVWPDAHVLAADNDPIAVDIAAANGKLNGVSIQCALSEGMEAGVVRDNGPYDLIVANILMQPLIELAPGIVAALQKSGRIILSGLLESQKAAVEAAYEQQGMKLERHILLEGWSSLMLHQP
ncbi:MAG TPA: 50S ribosomal protein L11 methyltransferase [Sphingomonadales bacterium]